MPSRELLSAIAVPQLFCRRYVDRAQTASMCLLGTRQHILGFTARKEECMFVLER